MLVHINSWSFIYFFLSSKNLIYLTVSPKDPLKKKVILFLSTDESTVLLLRLFPLCYSTWKLPVENEIYVNINTTPVPKATIRILFCRCVQIVDRIFFNLHSTSCVLNCFVTISKLIKQHITTFRIFNYYQNIYTWSSADFRNYIL